MQMSLDLANALPGRFSVPLFLMEPYGLCQTDSHKPYPCRGYDLRVDLTALSWKHVS